MAGLAKCIRRVGRASPATRTFLALALALGAPLPAHAARQAAGDLNKLDSHLQALVEDERQGRDLQRTERREGIDVSAGGRVLVDVYVKGDVRAAAARLRQAGMDVDATSDEGRFFRIVEGRLPADVVARAARLPGVRAVVGIPPPVLDVGGQTSEGDAAHRGPQARALGPDGSGVDVGVISDSIDQVGNGVEDSQGTGDLPPNVTVLSDFPGGTDEGRAMAEIVFDTAPGIERIIFGTAFGGGAAGKADTIDDIVAAGAEVIADDTVIFSEPFFQDGVVAQAVDRARAAGVNYFVSSGNRGRQSLERTFEPSGGNGLSGEPLHDFDPGAGSDTLQQVATLSPGAQLSIFLQWDEAFGQAETDIDLYITNLAGGVLASGTTDNIASGIPFESATFTNAGATDLPVAVAIGNIPGGRSSPFMKYIANGNFGPFAIQEHATNSDAINPEAASARGAITVGAIAHNDFGLDTVEAFSSRGPKSRLFDAAGNRLPSPELRQKPDIAAADRVSTTVPGFETFAGTSAAAPSAAGVGALIRSADSTLNADDVAAIMTDPRATNDCGLAGDPDTDCGFGFAFADAGVLQANDNTPPIVTPQLDPAAPNGANGFYTSNVQAGWAVVDPESAISSTPGCGATTVDSDTAGTTFTCRARSAGGTSEQSVQVKRDASPPTAPVFAGISGSVFDMPLLPARSEISCSASDPTSGVEACAISGYRSRRGRHSLTGTATNGAGLTATAAFPYRVTGSTIGRVRSARRIDLDSFLSNGLVAAVGVEVDDTVLAARMTATVPGSARAARRVRVARVRRRVQSGRARLRIRPNARGRRLLRNRSQTVLRLRLTGIAPNRARTIRRRTVRARR